MQAAEVLAELQLFVERLHMTDGERIDHRRWRGVVCGEHGNQESQRDTCPRCGGYAQPMPNTLLTRRGHSTEPESQPDAEECFVAPI